MTPSETKAYNAAIEDVRSAIQRTNLNALLILENLKKPEHPEPEADIESRIKKLEDIAKMYFISDGEGGMSNVFTGEKHVFEPIDSGVPDYNFGAEARTTLIGDGC